MRHAPRIRSGVIVTLTSAMLAACGNGTEPVPTALTALPRALTSQETAVIGASNAFTLSLFKQVSAEEPAKNVFVSPLSASMALGMTLNGARGSTFDAMRSTLQFGSSEQVAINEGYKSLMSLLTGLDPTSEMRVANSIWFRNTFPISPEFTAAGRNFFDAEVAALDFANVEASKATINAWVNASTSGRIPTIVDEIASEEVMFLINAIYFKARWRMRFDPKDTKPADFTPASGPKQTAQMMYIERDSLNGRDFPDGTAVAQLPYGNTAFNMVVVLPPQGTTLDGFVAGLTPDRWTELTSGIPGAKVELWFPRLELKYERKLGPDLASLGMGIAFSNAADFRGMTTTPLGLRISKVIQKTFLKIDEEGTEAAAATSVGVRVTSAPLRVTMRCDRPYLVAIRERFSGTIVFVGKVNTM
ncbi:MAG TPA: serpin family protein [Gemmatimonadaceae bacterium]|nr:serpin family protein [Gemmatimonadaceae bacterium]